MVLDSDVRRFAETNIRFFNVSDRFSVQTDVNLLSSSERLLERRSERLFHPQSRLQAGGSGEAAGAREPGPGPPRSRTAIGGGVRPSNLLLETRNIWVSPAETMKLGSDSLQPFPPPGPAAVAQ